MPGSGIGIETEKESGVILALKDPALHIGGQG